jgi:hypothetical protein
MLLSAILLFPVGATATLMALATGARTAPTKARSRKTAKAGEP